MSGEKVLLVDDDEAFVDAMRRGLERHGMQVETASDAEAGLALLRSFTPDRILLDLNLPGRSGLLALPDYLQRCPGVEVVMLTGYSSIATAVKAIKLGALNYLCKPATLKEVLDAFREAPATETTSVESIPDQPLSVDRLEWEYIQKMLDQFDGNISATAKALGMHRRTLQRKLAKRPVRR